jgi:hypothetical protein
LSGGAFFQRADVGVDDDQAVVKVGVVALECGEFAPAATGPGGGDDEQCATAVVELRGLVGAAEDFFGGGPEHFADDVVGASAAVAVVMDRVGRNEPVVDSVAEDAAQEAEQAVDGGVLIAAGVEVGGPSLDVAAVDDAQCGVAEPRRDVFAGQVGVVLDGEVVHGQGRPSSGEPVIKRRLCQCRVVDGVTALVHFDLADAVLGGGRAGEAAFGPHGAVAAGADSPVFTTGPLYPCHDNHPPRTGLAATSVILRRRRTRKYTTGAGS